MNIEGILIDFDNTLYDYEPCHELALSAVFANIHSQLKMDSAEFDVRYRRAKQLVHATLHGQASSHNRLLYFQKLLEQFPHSVEKPYSLVLECYNLYWDTFIDSMELFPHALPWLAEMKNRNLPIVMVTDLTADVQFRKIAKLQLDSYFSYVVTSEEAGCEKPHPYVFQLALSKCGLSADKVWMIGDSYEKDVIGASNLNIPAFWLNRSGKSKELPDRVIEIKDFSEMWGYI